MENSQKEVNASYDIEKGDESPKNKVVNLSLRTLMSFIGIALLSMGAMFLKKSGLGLDPFTAMNIGFSSITHIQLGTFQLSVNFVMFLVVLLLDRKQIGIGTILNMVLVGYEIEWFAKMYDHFLSSGSNIYVIIVDLTIGLLLFTLGTSIYMSTNLGASPYDAIAPIITKRLHAKYQVVRSFQDIAFMVIAFFAHGAVGILTLVIAFFAGPLINFWTNSVAHQIMYHIDNFSAEPTIKHAGHSITDFGKFGYKMLQHAYYQTNFMEQHMAGYTDEELIEMIHSTEIKIQRTKHLQQNLTYRYRSLKAEAHKRHIKVSNDIDKKAS